MAVALSSSTLSFTLAAEDVTKAEIQESADKELITTEFDEVLVSATRISEKASKLAVAWPLWVKNSLRLRKLLLWQMRLNMRPIFR